MPGGGSLLSLGRRPVFLHVQLAAGGQENKVPPVGLQRSGASWCQARGHSENCPWAPVGDSRLRSKIPIIQGNGKTVLYAKLFTVCYIYDTYIHEVLPGGGLTLGY